jgi:GntR family transcriptional regulator / MocR family aminotransferase
MPKLPELLPVWAAPLLRAAGARRLGSADVVARLRAALEEGALPAGASLPTSRGLAQQLGVSRNTVVAAYAQLTLEGWLQGRGRHGTFAAEVRPAEWRTTRDRTPALLRRRSQSEVAIVPAQLDWRLGQSSAVRLPTAAWERASRYGGRFYPPTGYGDPAGAAALREAVARALARLRGLRLSAEHILITQGAASALDLIVETLVMRGDVCVVENPGYPRITQLLQRQGAVLRHAPVDEQGLAVGAAFEGARAPALLHVTPAHQYPVGVRLSPERRRELIALARRHGTLIVENEYDHEFIHAGQHHAPLFAAAPERVVLVGTFAKAVSPSLRLGYVVAMPSTIERLAAHVARAKRHVSWPGQHAMTWLLESGEFDRHLRRVRRQSARLAEQLVHALERWRDSLHTIGETGGQHALLRVGTAHAAKRLQRALSARGVLLDPLDAFAVGATGWHGVLMSYGHMQTAELGAAMVLLDEAMVQVAEH